MKAAFKSAGFGLPPGTTNLDMAGVFKKKGFDFDCPNFLILRFCSRRMPLKSLALKRAPGFSYHATLSLRKVQPRTHVSRLRLSSLTPFLEFLKNKDALKSIVDEVRAMI